MEPKKSRDTIKSLEVGISIIDALVESKQPMRFSDIQAKTQITKSNLYKYLNTLMESNILIRETSTGFYHLGSKLIKYGMTAIGNQDVVSIITPYLQTISQYSNCSVLFASCTIRGPVITKIWSSDQILNIGAQLGTLLPPNSSSGKVFNVFSNSQLNADWQSGSVFVLTPEDREYQNIKGRKIAFANEPLIESISSVSIPVVSFNAELLGIITVVGFSSDIPTSINESLSQYLMNMQSKISAHF